MAENEGGAPSPIDRLREELAALIKTAPEETLTLMKQAATSTQAQDSATKRDTYLSQQRTKLEELRNRNPIYVKKDDDKKNSVFGTDKPTR